MLEAQCKSLQEQGAVRVIADMSRLEYISSLDLR